MEFTRKSQPALLYDSIFKKHLALNNIIFSGTVELFQSVFETVGLTLLFSVIIKPYYFAVILRSSCRYDVTCKFLKILQRLSKMTCKSWFLCFKKKINAKPVLILNTSRFSLFTFLVEKGLILGRIMAKLRA
jgi:hypothetical protein